MIRGSTSERSCPVRGASSNSCRQRPRSCFSRSAWRGADWDCPRFRIEALLVRNLELVRRGDGQRPPTWDSSQTLQALPLHGLPRESSLGGGDHTFGTSSRFGLHKGFDPESRADPSRLRAGRPRRSSTGRSGGSCSTRPPARTAAFGTSTRGSVNAGARRLTGQPSGGDPRADARCRHRGPRSAAHPGALRTERDRRAGSRPTLNERPAASARALSIFDSMLN